MRDTSWDGAESGARWGYHAFPLDDEMDAYLTAVHGLHDPIYAELLAETAEQPNDVITGTPVAGKGVPVVQGAVLAWLIRAFGFSQVVELGTFTGLSTLMMAEALPEDGKIVTCDIDAVTTRVARKYWRKAKVDDRISLELRSGVLVLQEMAEQNRAVEFAFVDADKILTHRYLDLILDVMVEGGVIAFDNVLWHGEVLDLNSRRGEAAVLERFNRLVLRDERVDAILLPMFDGLLLAQKR